MPIRVLPEEVANRIAAGEVVERPASVIKELIENAIDAGADEIRIEIQAGGHRMMRVLDDGDGIPSDEVALAFERHSTSKLTTVDDLESIRTLGFRGEALASIASVARVTLVTRALGETVGCRVRLDGGQLTAREPSGRPPGTAVTVEDLFYNVPARRKFLRTERTERRHIDALVTRYALAYPQLRFILDHDGRTTFQSHGSGDLREVLIAVYGAQNGSQMLKVTGPSETEVSSGSAIQVEGYVSAPALHRSNRNEVSLFINGRWIQDQRLTFAVTQAYHTLLMAKRYPLAVLKIQVPPTDVDVNVHPAKTEVRFRDGDAVFRAVQRAVRRTLLDQASVPEFEAARPASLDEGGESRERNDWPGAWPTPDQFLRRARLRALGTAAAGRSASAEEIQFALQLPRSVEGSGVLPGERESPPAAEKGASPSTGTESASARVIPFLRVVGQLGLTYIIAEGPEGMFLIDQHAAHERVLYEQFMADQAQARTASQRLLESEAVELTPEGASLVEEHLEGLLKLGFDVEPFGGSTVLVRAIPALLVGQDVQSILDEIVADLQEGERPLADVAEARIVRRVCKQAAIRAGQALSQQEMDELVRQLEACASPRTCPHGRPTMLHLSATQLAREFGRLG